MKGIAQILFGSAVLLLGILAAVMFSAGSDWYLWIGLIIVAPFVGIVFAIIGLVNVCQQCKEGEKEMREEDQPEAEKND